MNRKKIVKNIIGVICINILVIFFINLNISFAANMATISAETVNMRGFPDTGSSILVQLVQGDQVEIFDKTDNWYRVTAQGITGYIRDDLLTVNEQSVETDPVPEPEVPETPQEENVPVADLEENLEIALGQNTLGKTTRLKLVPVINATDMNEITVGTEVQVTEILGDWIYIETDSLKGWIRAENIQKEETETESQTEDLVVQDENIQTQEQDVPVENSQKTMYVNSTTINLRREASTTSEIIIQLSINQEVTVLSEENGWSKVKVGNQEGYISSTLLSSEKQEVTSRSMTTTYEAPVAQATLAVATSSGTSIIDTAKSYLGYGYSYGGSSPSTGFDCSGFTKYIFGLKGINLSRTASAQYSNGYYVSKAELQVGDLVMFGSSQSSIYHVGIYIGGGQMVHAANPQRGVVIDTINSGYYATNYYGARRVI